MIEIYAFLAIFTIQILAMSVLFPSLMIRYVRRQASNYPDRLAQLFPGVDPIQSIERFATRFRATNTVIAVLGLVLLGWMFNYMQRPDWSHKPLVGPIVLCFMAQALPLFLEVVLGFGSYLKLLKQPSPQGKRKAVLQRRGLFDFVSPFAVILAVLAYFLYAAFLVYLHQRGMPTNTAIINFCAVTLVYALFAFTLYVMLYKSRVFNPLETQESRGHWIGVQAKGIVYSGIFMVAFLALLPALDALNMQRWLPFSLSAFFVGCSVSFFTSLSAAPHRPGASELDSSPVH